jgi:hypothetical protein
MFELMAVIISLNDLKTLNVISYTLYIMMILSSINMFYYHFMVTRFRIYIGWYILSIIISILSVLLNFGYLITYNIIKYNNYIWYLLTNISTINISILWIIHLLIEILLSNVNNGILYTLVSIHVGIVVLNSHRVYICSANCLMEKEQQMQKTGN